MEIKKMEIKKWIEYFGFLLSLSWVFFHLAFGNHGTVGEGRDQF